MFARVCLLGALACAGCGDSMSPLEPTPDIVGAWTGQIGSPMSGAALRLSWTASQSGRTASGPARFVKPMVGTELPGTMTGTINGNQVALVFAAAPGGVPTVPDCAASGRGTGTITRTFISGRFTLTATGCDSIGIESVDDVALTMMR